ncbi:hypothetical protein [Bacillus thuringiensis]|uniref:hypothetical protein n=1 Tax=Bacillus thuringiensis TaxID=1428 RepID=UPI001F511F45|nr:hypothetical protein [Bacillus thuringiensis]
MRLTQSIEGMYINPFTLPEVGAEVKKNKLIFGKPGRGKKFNLMQELNRYAEDLVVSSKVYQEVEQATIWKEVLVQKIRGIASNL